MPKSHAITFGRLHTWTLTFYYDKGRDVLTIRAPWREEAPSAAGEPPQLAIDLPEGVRVTVERTSGEALAFTIPAFRKRFLAVRPDLAALWEQVKPSPIALRRMENTPFIGSFLEHMERLAYDRDLQLDPSAL